MASPYPNGLSEVIAPGLPLRHLIRLLPGPFGFAASFSPICTVPNKAGWPVACLPPDDPGVFENFHSPLGVFTPLRIEAFNFEPAWKLA
jgi:hypothetical protein